MAQTGPRPGEKNLPRSSGRDKEFLEGLSQQHVRELEMRLDQSADTATDKQWINCWMLEFFFFFFPPPSAFEGSGVAMVTELQTTAFHFTTVLFFCYYQANQNHFYY